MGLVKFLVKTADMIDRTFASGNIKEWAVNRKLKELGIGKVLELQLDPEKKTIRVKADLEGENEPIEIKVGNYQLTEENGKSKITVQDIDVSREWMKIIIKKFAENKTFDLPDEAKDYLSILK